MEILYFTLISSYFLSFIGRKIGTKEKFGYLIPNNILTFISISIIAIVSSLRSNIGDT